MTLTPAVFALIVLLVLAFPYVRRAKHPGARTFAAYLLFVSTFSLISAILYTALGAIATALGLGDALARPAAALVFLALIFLPAFLVARWQVRKPPRRVSPP